MKALFALCFSLLVITSLGQSLEEGLILHYPFDGNVLDVSDNHNDGLSNVTFCQDHTGAEVKAIHFNGYDQYLNFPVNKSGLKPGLPLSFAFWVKFDDLDVVKTYIFDTDFDQNNHSGVWMNLTPAGTLSISYGDASGSTTPYSRRTMIGSTPIEIFNWYHVIGIIRGPADMDIFINGVEEEGYYEGSGGYIGYTDCQGNLGRIDGSVGVTPYYFQGFLDDFWYWNKALDNEEIDSLCLLVNLGEMTNSFDPGVTVFPNPVSRSLTIENMPASTEQIIITDLEGRQVEVYSARNVINVSGLHPGNYLLKFQDKEQNNLQVLKVIKL
jgi:hypothetical protein